MPTARFSIMSIRPIPYAPARPFSCAISSASGSSSPSSETGTPALEADDDLDRRRRRRGIAGQRVRLLRRRVPGILEHAGLDRAPEQVLVDRDTARPAVAWTGMPLRERVLDLLVARPDAVAQRRDHL